MKKTKWIMGIVLALFTLLRPVYGQDNQSKENEPSKAQSGDNQEQGDPDIYIKENSQPGTGDTPGAAEAAARANESESDTLAEVSNAPVVPQTTASSSGSPAVLSGNRGAERDGTNTMQRASMNMVGSPVGNLNLSEGQAADPDTELADRQNRTQGKQISAEAHSPGDSEASGSNEINNNSRRENNALSDQNLSSKDKKDQSAPEQDKKQDKRKRKKDRG